MLHATQAGRLTVAPQGDEGKTPFPDHRGFRQELSYDEDEKFDIREKLPADFAGLEAPEDVAEALEELLAAQNPHFELVDGDGDGPAGDQEDE
jgi:hypothetical protein